MEDDDDHTMTAETWSSELFVTYGYFDNDQDKAEAFNKLLARHMLPEVLDWSFEGTGWSFSLSHSTVNVFSETLKPTGVVVSSDSMHRRFLDPMRVELRRILEEASQCHYSSLQVIVVLLQLVEEAAIWQHAWEEARIPAATPTPHTTAWNANTVNDWASILDNPHGVDLASIEDTALDILGESITNICAKVSKDLRILHVEPVFRNDLVARFRTKRLQIFNDLRKLSLCDLKKSVAPEKIRQNATVEEMAQELAMPTVTYHGAPRRVVESIVRYGFIVPGQQIGNTGKIQSGAATFGYGIYSSPDTMYASHYFDYMSGNPGATRPSDVAGMRLLVCATLMGRPLSVTSQDARYSRQPLDHESHSHVASHLPEYVVFDNAQIIPCYVLHLDYGAKQARAEFEKIAADPEQYFSQRQQRLSVNKWVEPVLCPGDKQRKKQALAAAAAKWFAYGFGPKQGSNIVVEDIADVSDDEEVYGDFQNQRIEQESEIRDQNLEERGSWFDEYQTVRTSKRQVHVRGKWDS